MKDYLQIHPDDNVAVALKPLPGIPAGHKFAITDIPQGNDVIKYGYPIGHATQDIHRGQHVHSHNIATNLTGTIDYNDITPVSTLPSSPLLWRGVGGEVPRGEVPTFLAYPRPDGQVGIRNDIWVIPTVGCVNPICRQIAEQTQAIHLPHPYGCSQLGDDHENTRRILRDIILHPNAGGVLVVGLGCENNQPHDLQAILGNYDPTRIRFLVCQEVQGDEVQAGVQIVRQLHQQAQTYTPVPTPISQLRVGLKCGGSDGFSGITANPLLGAFTDWLCTQQGGTAILTEVPEMFGAETILMRRAANKHVLQQTINLINDFKQYYISHNQPIAENPSPGNKAGGISTLEEKALGCTQKAGNATVVGVLQYAQTLPPPTGAIPPPYTSPSLPGPYPLPTADPPLSFGEGSGVRSPGVGLGSGLFLLAAPGNDLVASTALAAAGCHILLFTTGRGTPFSTFVPTLKISTNSQLARRKPHWIDFDAGPILDGTHIGDLCQQFIQHIIAVASGQIPTKAEIHHNAEIAIFKNGVTL